uniref:Uncharacterized protein n=1 Tax=Periophthalmus magnuspinnatus TaxID=409849 RepID=A0A3B4BML2_9GOBI
MSDHPDCLQFTLSSHPEAVLSRMNILREERHFCDITLLLGGPVGATEHPYFLFSTLTSILQTEAPMYHSLNTCVPLPHL